MSGEFYPGAGRRVLLRHVPPVIPEALQTQRAEGLLHEPAHIVRPFRGVQDFRTRLQSGIFRLEHWTAIVKRLGGNVMRANTPSQLLYL